MTNYTLQDVKIEEHVKVNLQLSQVCDDYKIETSKETEIQRRRIQSETDLDSDFSWLPSYPHLLG